MHAYIHTCLDSEGDALVCCHAVGIGKEIRLHGLKYLLLRVQLGVRIACIM